MKRYIVDGRVFFTLEEAIQYANWLAKISNIFVAVEELKT